jgi:FAD/FMN-containing dehydrogenase
MSEFITLYEPDEMIIMCKPAITLAELDETLKQHGQWMATLLPDEREDATLGEALMRNTFHPRARFGSPLATSVLGGTFVTKNGHEFKSGSRVVKSVAGYDTHRAYVGSEGKLFDAIELTLKVMPRPKQFLRFKAALELRPLMMQRKPLILEEWDEELVVEFAGEAEDIAEDRGWLTQYDHALIGNDWGATIKSISKVRDRELRAKPVDPIAMQLLDQLKEKITA